MIGRTVSHYQIVGEIGKGGMGTVYKARDVHLDRIVAIKALSDAAAGSRARLLDEARAASALNHPNIVTVHEVVAEGDCQFIVMEFVDGRTLRSLIAPGGMDIPKAIDVALQLATALCKAHAAGILHRDLKPSNVMITGDGVVKLVDFGLARNASRADCDVSTITLRSGEGGPHITGTLAYMSPEQAEGRSIDIRSDIFSFGAVVYEMLTGRPAFERDSLAGTFTAILHHDPEHASRVREDLPQEFDEFLERCLHKDRGGRWQSMEEVRKALQIVSAQVRLPAKRRIWNRRKARAAAWFAIVLLASAPVVTEYRIRTSPNTEDLAIAPFTSHSGREMFPSISPDGTRVAFVWNGEKEDNFDIYVKLIGAGPPLRLTSHPAPDLYPAWSPDGRHIVFVRYPEVFMVSSLGGPERTVARASGQSSAPGISWSPEGRTLAVVDRENDTLPDSIVLVSLETGEKRKLTNPPPGSTGDSWPVFSPDGSVLAFLRRPNYAATEGDLFVVPATHQAETTFAEPLRLTNDRREIYGFDWSPDGKRLIFASSRAGFRKLWLVGVPARLMSAALRPPVLVAAGGDNAAFPSVARQGNRLVYQQASDESDIWSVSLKEGNASEPGRLISSTQHDTSPQISPDGSRIAFMSKRSGYEEIWACRIDGSEPVQITGFAGPSVGTPRWSPDGRFIAFDSTRSGNRDIFRISADGANVQQLTYEPAQDVRPSWSRDGRWIYFGSNRSAGWQVWRMPSSGGAGVQVTRGGGREAFESRDSQFIYYAKEQRIDGIWRVRSDSGFEEQVLKAGGQGHFAITATALFVLDWRSRRIASYDLDHFRPLFTWPLPASARPTPIDPTFAIAPDSRLALYGSNEKPRSDLILVEKFR